MSMEINLRITECRKKARMTKKEVAARLGIKYTTYCRMEEKAKRITNAEIEQIAEVLGADAHYILYGFEKPKENIFAPIEPVKLVLETPDKGSMPFEYPESPVTSYSESEFPCTSEERVMIRIYRGLPWEKKQIVRDFFNEL